MPIVLIYHDVIPAGDFDSSGITGPGAAHYKFFEDEFRQHLEALARVANDRRSGQSGFAAPGGSLLPCILTFDDGGRSASTTIAGMLEDRGWRGQFFVSTDFLDRPGFMTRSEVADLHRRGHVIGSHSCSHPHRMSACSWEQLVDEWRVSSEILSHVTGECITSGSIPGGYYSRCVAAAAAHAGIRILFTSEPTARPRVVDGCVVKGRYSIDRSVSIETMAAIAAGRFLPRFRQSLAWQAKKAAKTVAGPLYAGIRRRWLQSDYDAHRPSEEKITPASGVQS